MIRTCAIPLLLATMSIGCQAPPGPIFPRVDPPIVWPPAPDTPRIRYVGELRGEASLGVRATGWEALGEILTGPKPRVEFSRPSAVAVAGTRIFVADIGLGVVHMLDLATREYRTLRGPAAGQFRVPIDLAVVADDSLAVVDRGRGVVDVFDLDGRHRRTRRWDRLSAPLAVTAGITDAGGPLLWLVDGATHSCFAYAIDQDTFIRQLGQRGPAPGEFNFPTAVAWRPQVGLVVADAMNFRVQVFDDTGTATAVFGRKGNAAGDFSRPRDVAIDSAGHIYVLDNQFENVQIFDPAGQLLLAFGRGGDGPGEFALPSGITIDDQDRIWIADSYNHRVQVFEYMAEAVACAD